MCFPVYECFFCIKLSVATKLIGVLYMVVGGGLVVLFGVPVVLAWTALPLPRAYFYAAMTASAAALFVTSCLLLVASFSKRPVLMKPWVVTSWCTSVVLMAVCVVGMVTIPFRFVDSDTTAEESCVISVYFIHALLLFYFSSVVNSHRHELKLLESTKTIERLMFPTIHNAYRESV